MTDMRKVFPRRGKHYVIIGNSAAGIAAAQEVRRWDPKGVITTISDEPTYGYSRVMLPLYISGRIRKRDMVIAPKGFYTNLKIRLWRGDPVESTDPQKQRVYTRKGKSYPYDRLLVATGSSPRIPNIPGRDLPGIHYLRKISNAEAIRRDLISTPGPVLLVGGGLVSVKSLEALIHKKRKVHMVISSDRVLSQMLDQEASDRFLQVFRKEGVSIHMQTDVHAFEGKKRLEGALLSDGTFLPCSLAIVGKGVEPNVELLKGSGIERNQGVIVDSHMASNLPFVYAAGDVAEPVDLLQNKNLGKAIWPLAVEGGRVAGSNMASVPSTFSGSLRMNVIDILGLRVVSVGNREGEQIVKYSLKGPFLYRKLVFSEGRLTGFILGGDIRCAGLLTSLVKNRTEVSISSLEEGLGRGFSYSPRLRILGGQIKTEVEYKL
jgi:NAD(P)H-nitrite reductase large subunit